jgi:hypothetical protein
MGFGARTGLDSSPGFPRAFTFCFLDVLAFRFMELHSQIDSDASKTSLRLNRYR